MFTMFHKNRSMHFKVMKYDIQPNISHTIKLLFVMRIRHYNGPYTGLLYTHKPGDIWLQSSTSTLTCPWISMEIFPKQMFRFKYSI